MLRIYFFCSMNTYQDVYEPINRTRFILLIVLLCVVVFYYSTTTVTVVQADNETCVALENCLE